MAMPGLDGLKLQRALAVAEIPRPIIFLSGRSDVPTSVKAMKAGAVDFLTKPVNADDLVAAVQRAIDIDLQARRDQTELNEVLQRLGALTPREREVLQHVVAGRLNKQIAAALGTVEKTIKVHRARVMEKMHTRSVVELVRMTQRAGIESRTIRKAGCNWAPPVAAWHRPWSNTQPSRQSAISTMVATASPIPSAAVPA